MSVQWIVCNAFQGFLLRGCGAAVCADMALQALASIFNQIQHMLKALRLFVIWSKYASALLSKTSSMRVPRNPVYGYAQTVV